MSVHMNVFQQKISPQDFQQLSRFIESHCGIKMHQNKQQMVEGRLRKRLRQLGFTDFSQYIQYVFQTPAGQDEVISLIDVITTNKTDFFREPAHFAFLRSKALPSILQHTPSIRVWSAGCSTGEEPYTLAMVLSEELTEREVDFSILATDISTQVLEKARLAIYSEAVAAQQIAQPLLRKYLLRSKDRSRKMVRFAPEVRARVQFRRLNFMESDYRIQHSFDVIFCRNVLIYFEKPVQEAILRKQIAHLKPGGYLFLGHSETLNGMSLPLKACAPTVYQKIAR